MKCFRELFLSLSVVFCTLCHVEAVPRLSPLEEDASGPVVQTNVGRIRGLRAEDGDYSKFTGIPYAQHDSDNFFGPALPYPPFESTFDAIHDPTKCPQIEENNKTIVGSVDCMDLNVYVPNSASADNKLPVFVWIYGGEFNYGFADEYIFGPNFIVRHDVIVVTFNYRLGPYGFMCLGTPEVPGNQGLKDQIIALRWIKENIEAFGGDNTRITLAGHSAGAISVDLHLYYDKEDLFQKIIIQSGVAIYPGLISSGDTTAPLKLAEYFNYNPNDLSDALSFLANIESDQLISASNELALKFGVCLEKEFEDVENFVTQLPLNMNVPRVKNVEVLIGFNNDESYFKTGHLPDIVFEQSDFVQARLTGSFDFKGEDALYKEMHEIVTHFYFGDKDLNVHLKREITDMGSDFYFLHPTLRTVKKYLDNGVQTLYLYLFSYTGGRDLIKHVYNLKGGGATHGDELGYLFDCSFFKKPIDPKDELIVDRITQLWTNFVKYGNPTPELTELVPVHWPPVTQDKWHYLELDSEIRVFTRPFHTRMAFLDLFYKTNEQFQVGYERKEETHEPETIEQSSACRDVVL